MNEEQKENEPVRSSDDPNLGSGCIVPTAASMKVPVSLYVVAGLLLASGVFVACLSSNSASNDRSTDDHIRNLGDLDGLEDL